MTAKEQYIWDEGTHDLINVEYSKNQKKLKVFAYDYGIKKNILRILTDLGCSVTVVPAETPYNEVLKNQPDGVFHGGATVALAESVGSAVSYMSIDYKDKTVRGIVISANHLKSVREGYVYAKATPLHKGRSTQLWEIKITDDNDNLISHCKLSTMVLNKNK